MKIRDYQRKKVYTFERALRQMYDVKPTLSLQQCEELVIRIHSDERRNGNPPSFKDGRGTRRALYYTHSHIISLPKWARSKCVTLHEYAHSLVSAKHSAHGPEFVSELIRLIDLYAKDEIPLSADAMKAIAIDMGVKYAY